MKLIPLSELTLSQIHEAVGGKGQRMQSYPTSHNRQKTEFYFQRSNSFACYKMRFYYERRDVHNLTHMFQIFGYKMVSLSRQKRIKSR